MTIEDKMKLIFLSLNDVIEELDYDGSGGARLDEVGLDALRKLRQSLFLISECIQMGELS
jgi:hypothetical protein